MQVTDNDINLCAFNSWNVLLMDIARFSSLIGYFTGKL